MSERTWPATLLAASLLIGPLLAFSYGVAVWLTYALAKECSWADPTWIVSLTLRLSLFVAAIACVLGVDASSTDAGVTAAVVLNVLSAAAIYQTRVRDVVGCDSPVARATKEDSAAPGDRERSTSSPFSWVRNKTILVTGANTGIGKETVTQLAQLNADTIILACRTRSKAMKAIEDVQSELNKTMSRSQRPLLSSTKLIFLPLDLGSLASVRRAAELLDSELKIENLDVLILNAGVMMGTKAVSENGYEMMMQANHLGHFLLTKLLLPKLQKIVAGSTGSARIVSLTSSTHVLAAQRPNGFDFDDMFCDSTRTYTLFSQYAMTKLANVLFAKELHRRFNKNTTNEMCRPIVSFAVHPGIVRTDVTRNMPLFMRVCNAVFAAFVSSMQKTPAQGAYSSVTCASANEDSEDFPKSGSYVVNCKAVPVLPNAESVESAKRLWEVSEQLVQAR